MVQLIKKGGLRERANRSRTYQGSENTETTLKPNRYQNTMPSVSHTDKNEEKMSCLSLHKPTHTNELDSQSITLTD